MSSVFLTGQVVNYMGTTNRVSPRMNDTEGRQTPPYCNHLNFIAIIHFMWNTFSSMYTAFSKRLASGTALGNLGTVRTSIRGAFSTRVAEGSAAAAAWAYFAGEWYEHYLFHFGH